MIQMNIQQRPTPTCSTETKNSLVRDACVLQTGGVALQLNTRHVNDPNGNLHKSLIPRQTNVVKSPQRPRCFAGAQKLSGSHRAVRCEFWEDVGSRWSQRPF